MNIEVNKKIFRKSFRLVNDFLTDTDKKTIPINIVTKNNKASLIIKKEDIIISCKIEDLKTISEGQLSFSLLDSKTLITSIKDKEIISIKDSKENNLVSIGKRKNDERCTELLGTVKSIPYNKDFPFPADFKLIGTFNTSLLLNSFKEVSPIVKNNPDGEQEYLKYINLDITYDNISMLTTDNFRIIKKSILNKNSLNDCFQIQKKIIDCIIKFLQLIADNFELKLYVNKKSIYIETNNIKAIFPIERTIEYLPLNLLLNSYNCNELINISDYLDSLKEIKSSLPKEFNGITVDKKDIDDLIVSISKNKVIKATLLNDSSMELFCKLHFKSFLNILEVISKDKIQINSPKINEPLVIEYLDNNEHYKAILLPCK